MASWLEVCGAFARRAQVEPAFVQALEAFDRANPRGGPPAPVELPWADSFEALERHATEPPAAPTVAELSADLAHEVDSEQAQMFARRLQAVDAMLREQGDATARVLRVGLWHRLRGIVDAPRPRALRVRALADFYYSYAGRHHHLRRVGGASLPSVAGLVAAAAWRDVVRGVQTSTVAGGSDAGPVHINLLRAEPAAVRLEVADCRASVAAAVPFADYVERTGAVAAVSGGFFLYSEPDIEPPSARHDPVGLLLRDGEVLSPPVFRRGALAVSRDGDVRVARVGLADVRITAPHHVTLDTAVTRASASTGPDAPSVAIVGHRVVACGHALPVPLNGFVVPTALPLRVGDDVRYDVPRLADGAVLHSAVAGGPRLVHRGAVDIELQAEGFWGSAPPVTFSQDETGDNNLLPRLAAGIDGAGRLVLAAFDGRNFEHALGMRLRDVAEIMLQLGCVEATNLDGGGSKRMVVQGRTLDIASTEIHAGAAASAALLVRPVYTCVLLHAV